MTAHNLGNESVQRPGCISRRKGPIKMLCPVCLQGIETDEHGVVEKHPDSVGIGDCPMSGKVGPTWDEQSTREAVPGRSMGWCEYCVGTVHQRRAQDMHHRKSRGVGGRWHPANILHLCRICHRFVTEHPAWAHALGLICKSNEDPAQRPVTREDGTWFQPTDDIAMPLPKRL